MSQRNGLLVWVASVLFSSTLVLGDPVIWIDVNVDLPGIQTARKVRVSQEFGIALIVGDNGLGTSPSVFDTIILEIFMNDNGTVLAVNPDQNPVALDLAANSLTTVDAFSGDPIDPLDELFLTPPSTPPGSFTLATGRAGLSDFGTSFSISDSDLIPVAAGKLNPFGFTPLLEGETTLLADAEITLSASPLTVTSMPSVVTIVAEDVPAASSWGLLTMALLTVTFASVLLVRRNVGPGSLN